MTVETGHASRERLPKLGLRANIGQFALLVAVNALVGGMVGQERTALPLLATNVFGLTAVSAALTFLVAFGIAKAITNLACRCAFRSIRPTCAATLTATSLLISWLKVQVLPGSPPRNSELPKNK